MYLFCLVKVGITLKKNKLDNLLHKLKNELVNYSNKLLTTTNSMLLPQYLFFLSAFRVHTHGTGKEMCLFKEGFLWFSVSC